MEGYDMFKMFKRVGIIYGVVLVAALVLFLATMFPVAAAIMALLAILYFVPRFKRMPLETSSCGDDDDFLSNLMRSYPYCKTNYFDEDEK